MLESARRLFFGGLFGKVLGVAREIILASLYGTGSIASSFRMAQSAFLIPFHGFLSDAVNGGFTPLFSSRFVKDRASAGVYFASLHSLLVAVAILLVGVSVFFAEGWIMFLAPGFSESDRELTVDLFCVFVVCLPFYALVSLYSAVDMLTSGGRMNALRPTIQSLGLIVGALVAYQTERPVFLAAGFLLAYLFMAVWGIHVSRAAGLPLFVRFWSTPDALSALYAVWNRAKFLLPIPVFIQLFQVVERRVASGFPPGTVAALDYAKFFSETAVVLFAVPFAISGLSYMAQMTDREFFESNRKSLTLLVLFGLLCSLFFYSNAEYLVSLLFERGSFDHNSTIMTSTILSACSVGIVFQVVLYGCGRFLSGRGENKVVLLASGVGIFFGSCFSLLFSARFGIASLGYAISIWSIVSCLIVLYKLEMLGFFGLELVKASAVFFTPFLLTLLADHYSLLSSSIAFVCSSALIFVLFLLLSSKYRRVMIDFVRVRSTD